MGAGRFVDKAKKLRGLTGTNSLSEYSLHTWSNRPQWGLKKGLRRARRRLDKEIIANEMIEFEEAIDEKDSDCNPEPDCDSD